jgi:hypothetical protein
MKPYFTKLVKAGDRLREFNFRKFADARLNLIHVDVSDERGSRHIFKMLCSEDQWKINDKNLPLWIYEVEEKLNQAILEE